MLSLAKTSRKTVLVAGSSKEVRLVTGRVSSEDKESWRRGQVKSPVLTDGFESRRTKEGGE